jgi:hypothetical protein
MKDLTTITEYQLLFLARLELSRRISEVKTGIITGKPSQSKRRAAEILLPMYYDQLAEIVARMAEINKAE